MKKHRRSDLGVVAQGMSDRDIAYLWHRAETGERADHIVDDMMAALRKEFSQADLADAVPTGVEAAIIRVTLRGAIVQGLRKNLMRRVIVARKA